MTGEAKEIAASILDDQIQEAERLRVEDEDADSLEDAILFGRMRALRDFDFNWYMCDPMIYDLDVDEL